jgi:hypothetical protein
MSNLSPPAFRSRILAAALVVATGGAASVGRTQQVTGSIGATLTIIEPVAAPRFLVSGFDVGRDGVARFETTIPLALRTPPLVIARVSSSTDFTPEAPASVLIAPASGATRLRYLVRVGRDRRADHTRPTELRVEYLIVAAGT